MFTAVAPHDNSQSLPDFSSPGDQAIMIDMASAMTALYNAWHYLALTACRRLPALDNCTSASLACRQGEDL